MKSIQSPVCTQPNKLPLGMRVCLVASIFTLAGCTSSERFEMSGAGHQIVAEVEGKHVVESHATHAAVSSQFGNVMIERDRARIDQAEWVRIPENVPVKMSISKHKVSIRAGAVSMSRTIK